MSQNSHKVLISILVLVCDHISATKGQGSQVLPSEQSAIVNISFTPPAIAAPYFEGNGMPWDEIVNITVHVSCFHIQNNRIRPYLGHLSLAFDCADKEICEIEAEDTNWSAHFTDTDDTREYTFNLTLCGLFLGRTSLELKSLNGTDKDTILIPHMAAMPINILRTRQGTRLNNIFTACIILFVVTNTFMMGTQLHLTVIWHSITRPVGPIVGFVCQYLIMPSVGVIAMCLGLIFLSRWPGLQFGFLAYGCAPGGGASNFWTLLLDGNLDLSVTMTFFSNLAALFMMPVWLFTAGRLFYAGNLVLPFQNIALSLMSMLIPATLGLIVGHFRPKWVPKFRKAVKIFTICVLIVIIGFSSYVNTYIYQLMRWYTLVPGAILPLSGYLLSYTVALLCRQTHQNARTIAIETGIQNAAIAILICQLSLPAPDNDLTLVMPISALMFTGAPLWVWLLVRTIRVKVFGYVDPDLVDKSQLEATESSVPLKTVPQEEDEEEENETNDIHVNGVDVIGKTVVSMV